uniref:Uncharacterized protein n=1 Tax=Anguilla anguilla TaxID=7936 RepID=A0A0E9WNS3_ANGAN
MSCVFMFRIKQRETCTKFGCEKTQVIWYVKIVTVDKLLSLFIYIQLKASLSIDQQLPVGNTITGNNATSTR